MSVRRPKRRNGSVNALFASKAFSSLTRPATVRRISCGPSDPNHRSCEYLMATSCPGFPNQPEWFGFNPLPCVTWRLHLWANRTHSLGPSDASSFGKSRTLVSNRSVMLLLSVYIYIRIIIYIYIYIIHKQIIYISIYVLYIYIYM